MKVLSTRVFKKGSELIKFSMTKEEEELFRFGARFQHKRFDKFFIRKEILKALKRYVRIYNG
jgi:hypothetical protein